MKLADYLAEKGKGTAKKIADALEVNESTVSRWASEKRRPSVDEAVRLSALTSGAVTVAEALGVALLPGARWF